MPLSDERLAAIRSWIEGYNLSVKNAVPVRLLAAYDELRAENEQLWAQVAAVEALLLKWEELTDPLCADCYDDLCAALTTEKGSDHAAE